MKVQISVVGVHPRPDATWPSDWPPPRIDEVVDIDGVSFFVREVVWYPEGDEEETTEPYVYVVVGTTRRGG